MTEEPKWESITISDQDIQSLTIRNGSGAKQALLGFLKSEGMPVVGHLLLQLDPAYEYQEIQARHLKTTQYMWRRRKEA